MATALRSLFELMGTDAALRGRELSNRNAEIQIDDFEAGAPAREAERRLSTIVNNAKATLAPRAAQVQAEGNEVALQEAKIAQSAKLNDLQRKLLAGAVDQSSFDSAVAQLEQLGGKPHPLRGKMFTPGLKKEFTDELTTAAQQIAQQQAAWQRAKDIEEMRRREREEGLKREQFAYDKDLNERKFAAGLDVDKRRLALQEREADIRARGNAPAGYRFKADGTLEAIPGGEAANPAVKATEDERKAATLAMRLKASLNDINRAIGENPDVAKPEVLPSVAGALPLVGDVMRNTLMSSDRQRVEAAQLDALDAALTLSTGAAYTKEQLQGLRKSYFPQIGDSDATAREKNARLKMIIDSALLRAGRMGANTDPANATKAPQPGGWSISRVK